MTNHAHADLHEILRHEAPVLSDVNQSCDTCKEDGRFRCEDCIGAGIMCKICIVVDHVDSKPLHKIQVRNFQRCSPFTTHVLLKVWNGKFFESTTLAALGLKIQLCHFYGDPCLKPSDPHDLMIFDLNGIHRVAVRYCHCKASRGVPHDIQLLRTRWLPTTIARPSTAFTFRFVDLLYGFQEQGTFSPYDYYHATAQESETGDLDQDVVSFLGLAKDKVF